MREDLARRERQIVEVLYGLGEGTSQQIRDALADDLADATIRTILRILEEKKVVTHRIDGRRFVYRPIVPRATAATSALQGVLDVFFGGSVEQALALHLSDPKTKLSQDELNRLRDLIDGKTKKRR